MMRLASEDERGETIVPVERSYVVRIELSPGRRRHLGAMARDAGVTADALATRLLADIIDEDSGAPSAAPPAVREAAPPEPTAIEPKPAPKPKLKTAPRSTRVPPATREPVEANGVRVDFAAEKVFFRGREVDVSSRSADIVAVLARAMPNLIPREDICERAWPDLSMSSGMSMLSSIRQPLTQRLSRIGLVLKVIHKLGLALQVAESSSSSPTT